MQQDLAKLRQQLSRVKPWVAVAVALGVALAGFYTFRGFQYYQVRGIPYFASGGEQGLLTRQIAAINQKLKGKQPEVEVTAAELRDRQLRLQELRANFSYSTTDELIRKVATIAAELKLDLTSVAPGDSKPDKRADTEYMVRPITVSLRGEIANINRFLETVHHQVPVVAVDNLRVSSIESRPAARISFLFYLLPEPSPEKAAK